MANDCGHHHDEGRWAKCRLLFTFLFGLLFLILLAILVIFLILRPSKPAFILRDATVYMFSATSASPRSPRPNLVNTNMQVTISSRNPNARIGIYYTQLSIYASYRGQQITLASLQQESYQGDEEEIDWSPFLSGEAVPISPSLGDALSQDLNAGMILINVKIDGRLKWKVGTWISDTYYLHVNCPALLMLKASSSEGASAVGSGLSVKVQLTEHCTVDV